MSSKLLACARMSDQFRYDTGPRSHPSRGSRCHTIVSRSASRYGIGSSSAASSTEKITVVAPIASASSVEQLAQLLPMLDLVLTDAERQLLDDASG